LQQTGKAISVPPPTKIDLLQAIQARRLCSAWFDAKSDDHISSPRTAEQSASDARHQYFIQVLEQAYELILPFFAAGPRRKRTKAPRSNVKTNSLPELDILNNRHDTLKVEDPLDGQEFHEMPSSKQSKKATHPSADTAVELEIKREDDIKFVVFCFFENLQKSRDLLKDIWQKAMANGSDILAASLVTNIAIDLVHKSEEEIIGLMGHSIDDEVQLSSYLETWFLIFIVRCLTGFLPLKQCGF
jgi:hypothetical protein